MTIEPSFLHHHLKGKQIENDKAGVLLCYLKQLAHFPKVFNVLLNIKKLSVDPSGQEC